MTNLIFKKKRISSCSTLCNEKNHFEREMIFEHQFCDNFLSHTHIIFTLSLSLLLWFSCKYLLFSL